MQSPIPATHDPNTVKHSKLNNGLKRQTIDTLAYTSVAPWPANPLWSLDKPSPILIKAKELFQIKLMRADMGPLSRLSVDASTQNRLRLNRPRDSQFGVTVYPPLGQSVHTCQLSHLPVKGESSRTAPERERENGRREKRQRQWVFIFLNKVQNPADSNKTVQLLSLLTQTNLSNTHEVWLVNVNYSTVDLTLSAGVKSEVSLPHSGGCVNYKTRHVWDKILLQHKHKNFFYYVTFSYNIAKTSLSVHVVDILWVTFMFVTPTVNVSSYLLFYVTKMFCKQ